MALNIAYGGGKNALIYYINGLHTKILSPTDLSEVTTPTTTHAALILGGSNAPLLTTDVAYDANSKPTITIEQVGVGAEIDAFFKKTCPRKAGSTSTVVNETGFDQSGVPWGSTVSASTQNVLVIVYGNKDAGGKVETTAFIGTVDPTSGSYKFEQSKAVRKNIKIIATNCKADPNFTVVSGMHLSTLVTGAAMTIAKDEYQSDPAQLTGV